MSLIAGILGETSQTRLMRLGVAAGVIVGSDGLPVLLRGITWPGFDTGTMVTNLQVQFAHKKHFPY